MFDFFGAPFVFEVGVETLVATVLTTIFVLFVYSRYQEYRYGGWVIKMFSTDGAELVTQKISASHAQELLEDEYRLKLVLKGTAADFGRLNFNILVQGLKWGVVVIDRKDRIFLIDLTKAPEGAFSPHKTQL